MSSEWKSLGKAEQETFEGLKKEDLTYEWISNDDGGVQTLSTTEGAEIASAQLRLPQHKIEQVDISVIYGSENEIDLEITTPVLGRRKIHAKRFLSGYVADSQGIQVTIPLERKD